MTPPQISATLQAITLALAFVWCVFIFWPALREQLRFIRESRITMEQSSARMEEMVASIEKVAADIEKVAEVKTDVNWEKTRGMVEQVYAKITRAIEWATPERQKAGRENLKRGTRAFAQVMAIAEKHFQLNGNGWRR